MRYTTAQFIEMERKRNGGKATGVMKETPERELHRFINDFCLRAGWLALHGSMGYRTHRTVGEPDFIILAQGRVLFVECKRPGAKMRPEQLALACWAEKLGHKVHVVHTEEEFIELL